MPVIVTSTETPVAASTIIARAMRLLGQIGAGESPTTDEYSDGLVALNDMIDAWRNDRLLTFAYRTESLTLAIGTESYGIGPSSDLDTNRPVEIIRAYVSSGNNDYPVALLSETEWAAIPDKTSTAEWPNVALFRASMSNATLLVHPVPSTSTPLYLVTRVPLEAFESSSDAIALAPGWARALAYNLAIELSPEFETQPSETVMRIANESLAGIKRVNQITRPSHLSTELSSLFGSTPARITDDQA